MKYSALLFVWENIQKADKFKHMPLYVVGMNGFMVHSLAVKQLRRRGKIFGCPTNAFLYSFALGGAVKAGVGVGSAFFRGQINTRPCHPRQFKGMSYNWPAVRPAAAIMAAARMIKIPPM